MLPDFPRLKTEIQKLLAMGLEDRIRQDPLFSQMRQVRFFEGDKWAIGRTHGDVDQSSFTKIVAEVPVKHDDVISKGVMAFVENVGVLAKQIQQQQATILFDAINKATTVTGNVVDAKGRPFTFELFLEMIEKMELSFDDEGNPHMPSLIVHPAMAAKIQENRAEWEANPEYKERLDEIIARKRREWNDRESHRELVD
jgi:hypothetical protein